MSSKILITANNEATGISFPVMPEKVEVSKKANNDSVNVVGLGEVTIFQDRPATRVTFSPELPAELCDAYQLVEKLESMKNKQKPVHFLCTNPPVNFYASIEDMPYYEQGGDIKSLYLSVTIKEYRAPGARKVTLAKSGGATTAAVSKTATRVDNRETPSTYTVASGDCLYNIAKKQLGDASKWPSIASLNGIKSPYAIYAKQTLKLPG